MNVTKARCGKGFVIRITEAEAKTFRTMCGHVGGSGNAYATSFISLYFDKAIDKQVSLDAKDLLMALRSALYKAGT